MFLRILLSGKRRGPAKRGLTKERGTVQALNLRCSAPASPTSPVPSKPSVPGSGTAVVVVMLVSPLEIVVEPLKKPLPVLIVS